jgi:transcriptional regulator with XRE-family HTH domain
MARGRLRGFDPERLRAARTESGMTQEQLAIRAGVARSAITAWEAGKNAPDPRRARAIAELLGIKIADLSELEEPDVRPADYRAWAGLTREGLSEVTGIGVAALAEIERYLRRPSPEIIETAAAALGIDGATYATAWDRGRREAEAGEF